MCFIKIEYRWNAYVSGAGTVYPSGVPEVALVCLGGSSWSIFSLCLVFCRYSQTCPCCHLYKAVTYIKRSPFPRLAIENFIWNEPLLRGHLSYKMIFSLSQLRPLNTGLTVVVCLLVLFLMQFYFCLSFFDLQHLITPLASSNFT